MAEGFGQEFTFEEKERETQKTIMINWILEPILKDEGEFEIWGAQLKMILKKSKIS